MGREVVLANIRKRMIAMIVGGVILTLMGGFISFAAVVAGEYSVLILGLFALTPGVIFLIFGTSRRTHPEKSGIFKANPDLLQQADELFYLFLGASKIFYEHCLLSLCLWVDKLVNIAHSRKH